MLGRVLLENTYTKSPPPKIMVLIIIANMTQLLLWASLLLPQLTLLLL